MKVCNCECFYWMNRNTRANCLVILSGGCGLCNERMQKRLHECVRLAFRSRAGNGFRVCEQHSTAERLIRRQRAREVLIDR